MPLSINSLGPAALELHVRGTIRQEDIEVFAALAEQRTANRGKLGLVVDICDLGGYSPSALWEDLKFDAKHYRDVSRLALVSDGSSKQWLATLAKPFTAAEVEYYAEDDMAAAREWVLEAA